MVPSPRILLLLEQKNPLKQRCNSMAIMLDHRSTAVFIDRRPLGPPLCGWVVDFTDRIVFSNLIAKAKLIPVWLLNFICIEINNLYKVLHIIMSTTNFSYNVQSHTSIGNKIVGVCTLHRAFLYSS